MAEVRCTCKSHCATYDHETGTNREGQIIHRSVAFRHRQDDKRSTGMDGFTRHVASPTLDEIPGPGLVRPGNEASDPHPSQTAALPPEVATLEGEIRDRTSWMATARPLVFSIDPVPDLEFEDPLVSSQYIPNYGPHALNPSNPNNIAFIENESRLYEIHRDLATDVLPVNGELLDELADKVDTGLRRMMEHKRCEWDRQRSRVRAVAEGYTIVNTGQSCEELRRERT